MNYELIVKLQESKNFTLAQAKWVDRIMDEEECDQDGAIEIMQDAEIEHQAWLDGPDVHGDFDPSPEEQAGWAMQDKIDMYRNEY